MYLYDVKLQSLKGQDHQLWHMYSIVGSPSLKTILPAQQKSQWDM